MTRLAVLPAPPASRPNDDVVSRAAGGHDAAAMARPARRSWGRSLARLASGLAAAGLAAALSACGGTADDFEDCSQAGQKEWVGSYMNDWYFRNPNNLLLGKPDCLHGTRPSCFC